MLADIRFAFRQLTKSPAFTAVVVLSLALGIGASATVLCWIRHVVSDGLPGVARQEEIVAVTTQRGDAIWATVSRPDAADLDKLGEVVVGVIGSQVTPATLTLNGKPEWVYGQIATANFFTVLGVKPILGRTFLPSEDEGRGAHPVLVLSETLWRRRFEADPEIIGRTVEMNHHTFTVVGVVPAQFVGTMNGLRCDFWAPLVMHREVANFGSLDVRKDRWMHTQARLRPGVSMQQAQSAFDVLAHQLTRAYPETNADIRFIATPLWKAPYGGQERIGPVLRILLVMSFGVLLIVAANVANLLLARATQRQREIAVRLAVGAGRVRLFRQMLTESLLLALLGGGLGVLCAVWMVGLFGSFIPKTHLPVYYDLWIDPRTLGWTVLLVLCTGLIFGLVPALQGSRPNLVDTLKDGARGSIGGSAHRLRRLLVVVEVALAVVLLVSAGLCIKGMHRARTLDIGFDPSHVLLAGLRVGMSGYDETTAKPFYQQLQERLSHVPGVEAAALCTWFPLGFEGGPSHWFVPEGMTPKPGQDYSAPFAIVSPGYFSVMRIPLVAGRDFTDRDDGTSEPVIIINEYLARQYWPGQDPLGRRVLINGAMRKVVGVARNGLYQKLNEAPQPFFFRPYRQGIWDLNLGICIRTSGDPRGYAQTVRETVASIDPGVAVWAMLPMSDYVEASFLSQKMASNLLAILGTLALILSAMGVYAVMAYTVNQRTQEFGVRMALGAAQRDILRLVVCEGLVLIGIGAVVGLSLAFGFTHLLANFLYGVSPFDWAVFLGIPLLLGLVGCLACWLPAQRATTVDPVEALRTE